MARKSAVLVLVLAMAAVLAPPLTVSALGPLEAVNSLPLGYRVNDVILDDTYAYLATDRGLTVVPLTQLQAGVTPTPCASVAKLGGNRSQGLAKKLAPNGHDYVYLAAGYLGIQIIDVTHPCAPGGTVVNTSPLYTPAAARGRVWDVAVHPTKDMLYAVSYNGELTVWDISDPTHPQFKRQFGIIMWGGGVCTTCVQRMEASVPNGTSYATGVSVSADGTLVAAVDWGYGGLYLWRVPADGFSLDFLGTHRLKISMFRGELDSGNDFAYILGAVPPNSGLIKVPITEIVDNGVNATYCMSLLYEWDRTLPTPAPAGTAPACGTTATCVQCGFARMETSTESYLAGDGGGVAISPNGKYVIYVGGRGTGELAIVDVSNMKKVWTQPVGLMGLQLAEAAGIWARRDVPGGPGRDLLYVAAGILGLKVYRFPGLSD